jgi:16S rRNA (cytidine1402-2'-O)-methyltransferase
VTGHLVLVATPIGNLGDLSPRAVQALSDADRILCEDTRRTRSLLSAFGQKSAGRLDSFHEHNEYEKTPHVIDRLLGGETVALVCDAGIDVSTVPGPSALLAALVLSGLPTERFVMEGFLPRKGAERRVRLSALVVERRTTVIYESPRRVGATVADLTDVLGGDRRLVVARELTKLHEEVWRGTLAEAAERYAGREVRGEVVLVLGGAPSIERAPSSDAEILEALEEAKADGLSTRDAASQVAADLGVARRVVYDVANRGSSAKR